MFALLAMAADAMLALRGRGAPVDVGVPDRIFLGEAACVTVTVAATPNLAFKCLLEQTGDLEPPAVVAAEATSDRKQRATPPLVPRRRGRVAIDRLWLRWHGPLRLAHFVRRVPIDRSIDVLPNISGVQGAALQFFAREAIYGTRVLQERGEGSDVDSLREYTPGLDTRFIDWKHSARDHKLVCKEFRVERNHPIVLTFDTGHLMLEPIDGQPRLDHAISAGLLLALDRVARR